MARTVKKHVAALAVAAAVALGLSGTGVRAADTDSHASELAHLEKAAQATDAKPGDLARNKAALGQFRWDEAKALLDQAVEQQLANERTVARIRRLGQSLNWSNLAVAGLSHSDPKQALAHFDQQIAAIRGDGESATWSAEKGAKLPTLSALKQQISNLEGDVSKRQAEIQSLTRQRDQLSGQADQLAAKSEKEKGRQSVEDFKKASDLRKKAADVQRQVDLATSRLTPRQQDLALAKAQRQAIEKGITQLEQERAALAAQWDAIQKEIQAQQQSAKKVYQQSGGHEEDTIAAQIAELNKGLEKVDQLRQAAVESLEKASTQFTGAANTAQNLLNQLRAQASAGGEMSEAEKTLQSVLSPQTYLLQKAAVTASLAEVKGAKAAALRHRIELTDFLTPILKKASVSVPKSLGDPSKLKSEAQAAQKEADKAFAETEQMLKQFGSGDVGKSATVLHILTLYNWSQLAAGAGDAKNAASRLQAAKALADNAARNNVPLPPLPSEITPAPAAAAPATKPA